MNEFTFININLLPWNFYSSNKYPDKSLSGNVYIGKSEWYNAMMPPFFLTSRGNIIKDIKEHLEKGDDYTDIWESSLGKKYLALLKNSLIFDRNKTIKSFKTRVHNYFDIEKKLIQFEPDKNSKELLSFIHLALCLMQFYMDPVEAITTGKAPKIKTGFNYSFFKKDENIVKSLSRSIPTEIIFIPLAVLLRKKSLSNRYEPIIKYMYKTMGCGMEELIIGLDIAERINKYSNLMNIIFAKRILDKTLKRIEGLENIDETDKLVNRVQEINGIMTWSKYIPIQKSPLRFRYDTTNNILLKVKKNKYVTRNNSLLNKLGFETNSGSEKQGKLYFLFNYLFKANKYLKDEIIAESIEFKKKLYEN